MCGALLGACRKCSIPTAPKTASRGTRHLVSKHPDDASKRVVAPVKNNLSEESSPRVYRIDEGRVVWLDEDIEWDADSIEQAFEGARSTPSAMEEAKRFLEEALGEGPELATKLREDAEGCGISIATLNRAKRAISVESFRRDGQWYWMIRKDESDEPRDSMPVQPEPDELVYEQQLDDESDLHELARLHGYEDNGFIE